MTINEVLSKLENVQQSGNGWSARCPAHDDEHPSLTVTAGANGQPLMYCHAECEYKAICKALGLSNTVATYDYTDEHANLLYQVCRTEPKGFFQRRPDGDGGFINDLAGVRRVPYRLLELLTANPQDIVFIPEGEKDVDALNGLDLIATCNSGGAGKWREQYSEFFRGRTVVVLPDNESAGEAHAQAVAKSLAGTAASVKIARLPSLDAGGDVSDWLETGGTKEELIVITDETPLLDSRLAAYISRENGAFTLTLLDDLLAEPKEENAYVWDRILPMGGFSICAAKPKVGKSTLARNLAVAVSRGEDFLGRATTQGEVIYLALEEKRTEIASHLRNMGAQGSTIRLHSGPTPKDPLAALRSAIDEYQPSLVVIDPVSRFLRVNDFNSYAEVTRVLEPLIDLARESGSHILALHHNGKGDRDSAILCWAPRRSMVR